MLQCLEDHMLDYGPIAAERQKKEEELEELESHFGGACPHIGKLSPGCLSCFSLNDFGQSVNLGNECNLNCPYCHDRPDRRPTNDNKLKDQLTRLFKYSHEKGFQQLEKIDFGFTGCEPFLYMNRMDKFLELFEEIQQRVNNNIRIKIYTNGLPLTPKKLNRLDEANVGEIELRFHPSASHFSDNVMKTMEEVSKRDFRFTVEETLYPPNRELLLNHLSDFESMGLHHLILKEARVYYDQTAKQIIDDYPDSKFYVMGRMYLYSEGMGYDIIEKSVDEGYSYNLLYCSPRTIAYKYNPGRKDLSNMLDAQEQVFDTENFYG